MRKLIAAAALCIMGTLGFAFPAHAAHKAVKGEYAFGPIRSGNNPGWCVTWEPHAPNHSPVTVNPCINGDKQQLWFMQRVVIAGQIDVIFYPDLFLGQHGKSDKAVLVNHIDNPVDPNIIGFYPIQNTPRYALLISGYHDYALSSAAVMKRGHVYSMNWQRLAATKKAVELFQSWDLPPWKPVKFLTAPR